MTINRANILQMLHAKHIDECITLFRTLFSVQVGLINLIGNRNNKDVGDIEIARLLNKELNSLPVASHSYVLVEKQPAKIGPMSNHAAHAIANQIVYHYIAAGCNNVELVSPHLKGTICFGDVKLSAGTNDNQKYKARKKYTTDCLKNFIDIFKLDIPLPKKTDDVADATMQALAWLKGTKLLTPYMNIIQSTRIIMENIEHTAETGI
jgi:hypothetical protein